MPSGEARSCPCRAGVSRGSYDQGRDDEIDVSQTICHPKTLVASRKHVDCLADELEGLFEISVLEEGCIASSYAAMWLMKQKDIGKLQS